VDDLREHFEIPIIGMEPAIKPAAESVDNGKILVLATHATLRLMKFQKLSESLGGKNIVPVECPGLSTLIENTRPGAPEIERYLTDVLSGYKRHEISAAVIGCTHYSFIENEIKKATGCRTIFDGRYGTVRHLKNTLIENDILSAGSPDTEYFFRGQENKYRALIDDFMERPLSFEE
jgi:glutamate racemase